MTTKLTLQPPITRRIILQQARSHTFLLLRESIGLELLVCIRLQVLFTPRQGYFSPFPRGTGSLSVGRSYLALESGLPRFPPDFTCPVVLRSLSRKSVPFRLQGSHLLWPAFPGRSTKGRIFDFPTSRSDKSYNPTGACAPVVWAIPRSLAATKGLRWIPWH